MRNKDLASVATTSLKSLWNQESAANDLKGVIRARDQLGRMYADSEKRLSAALNEVKRLSDELVAAKESAPEIFEGTKDALAGLTIKRQAD